MTYVPDLTERFTDGLGDTKPTPVWTDDDEYDRMRDDEAEALAGD